MMKATEAGTAFYEVQQFRQLWLWLLIGPVMLLAIGLMAWGMVTQLAFGNTWGSNPISDLALAIVGPVVTILSLLMLYAFYAMKLVTEIRDDGLYIRFFPIFRRRIEFERIARCEAVTYNSLTEYGGWGIRWAPGKGWAYNVSGGGGVRLELSGGKRLLIGSHRPEELARAIKERMQ